MILFIGKKTVAKVLLLVSFCGFGSFTFADEENLLFGNIPVVSQSTRRTESARASAANVRIITRDDMERYGMRTLEDVFMFIENGFETFKGVDRVFGLRGVMGYANDKIKFLIDGQEFPLELGLGEGEWPITLDEVRQIEIIKGPNTSVFGGNASQATINVIRYTGEDFQGSKTGLAAGRWDHIRGFEHYAAKASNDLNYDVYFAAAHQLGPKLDQRQWGADNPLYRVFRHDVTIGLPDYELTLALRGKNARLMYRRVEQRRVVYGNSATHNYSDAVAGEFRRPGLFENPSLDLVANLRASHFGQQYDPYHSGYANTSGIEHKAEKRLEGETRLHYDQERWDVLGGVGLNYWNAVGTEWGTYPTPYYYIAPDLVSSGSTTAEYFPAFTEINDLADVEVWSDLKYRANDKTNVVVGGRYVHDFVPGRQLRDSDSVGSFRTDRKLLRRFFPKAAVSYSPMDRMWWKFIYQEGFNRPNTFEQFSIQNTLPMRGTLKATTARTYELVLDWVVNPNLKTVVSTFKTNYYDFVNFAYTGTGWPVVDASKGEVRGFINVGDQETVGQEYSVELDYKRWGGFAGYGMLFKNKIYDVTTQLSGAAGRIDDDSDHNKQSFPEWNVSAGAWVKLTSKLTLSTLFTTHQNAKVSENWGGPDAVVSRNIHSWDFILNQKDFGVKKLDLQLLTKNVLDQRQFKGSALDPAHREQQWPFYYEARLVYLWGL